MSEKEKEMGAHPQGELKMQENRGLVYAGGDPMLVDTGGGRYHVAWDDTAPLTPMGQLVFFAQFLKVTELFERFCKDAPLAYESNNAHSTTDILGTFLLSILAGHHRYTHMTALRFDSVTPGLLGMKQVVSEDSARRALKRMDPEKTCEWQQSHLRSCWEPLLTVPWVMDIDSTVKTVFGKQEGAEVGYNPHKPGRPSHTYHTYWIAKIRICLDVEVRSGKQHSGKHTMPSLWRLIDSLPRRSWPMFLRGDCGYGSEENMREAEQRHLGYLFKQRQTPNVKQLIGMLETKGGWCKAGEGFEGIESVLQLTGWCCSRRVIVLRRVIKEKKQEEPQCFALGTDQAVLMDEGKIQYMVLVTNMDHSVEASAQLYRDRADSENPFDELKNQWGWGGFMTQDFARCQIMARSIAIAYNWWTLFVRLLDPHQHREAITSRPMMLAGVARQTSHAGQKGLSVSLIHGKADEIKQMMETASRFLKAVAEAAGQLTQVERWRLILCKIFEVFLKANPLKDPEGLLMSG